VPKDDPLARKKVITPADLDGKPMAMLFDDHSISEQTRKAFNEAGARLNKRFELRTFLPALQLVSEGLCYTICEGLSAISHQESFGDQNSLVFRPFKPECFLNMSLLTPANRPLSLLVESFAEVLRAEIKALVERAAGLRDLP
jgi:DNA-binding transcriptional LysR family regulator